MNDYLVFMHTTGPTIRPDIPCVILVKAIDREEACHQVFYNRQWNPRQQKVYLVAQRAEKYYNTAYEPNMGES